jgi:hypothetical protein
VNNWHDSLNNRHDSVNNWHDSVNNRHDSAAANSTMLSALECQCYIRRPTFTEAEPVPRQNDKLWKSTFATSYL